MESLIPLALIVAGIGLVLAGLFRPAGHGSGLGRLPGDLRASRGPLTFVAPLGTSLLLSVILTLALNLLVCGGPR